MYRSEEEHRTVFTHFLRLGLQNNHKVLYIVDTHTAETVLSYLRDEGLEPDHYLERGQLELLTRHETYTPGGSFDPDAMIDLLKSETEKAIEAGFSALRVTGEMTWALSKLPGTERLIEYENKLNRFMPTQPCIAICQYDKRQFEPQLLLDVLRTHPWAIIGTEVYENFYYLPPEQLLSDHPAQSELEHWIANLHHHAVKQQALEQSEQRYRDLYNSIRDAILVANTNRTIVHCNQAFVELFGYTLKEIEGRTTSCVYADMGEYRSLGNQLSRNGAEGIHFTIHYLTKEGRKFPGETTVFPLTDSDGTIKGYIGLIRDVSEREQVGAELARQRHFVSAVFETSGALIIEIAPDGTLRQVNRAGEKIIGYSWAELRQRSLRSLVPEEEYEDVRQVFEELLDGKYPNQHQNHWITKSGEKRFIAWTNTIIPDHEGRAESVLSTGIDITEHKQEEEDRIRRLEAEIARLESLSSPGTGSVTGRGYAQRSYREENPIDFSRLQKEYGDLLHKRLEERMYKIDNNVSGQLHRLSQNLGIAEAGPRDVMELHVQALRELNRGIPHKRAQALTEEGRLLAIELMGKLVSFYRNHIVSEGEQK